jgi:hypothetical protein
MLISRIHLDSDPVDVLKSVAAHSIEHLEYQHVSLAEIQHAIGLGGRRLFNTAMTVREADNFDDEKTQAVSFRYHDHQDPHEVRIGDPIKTYDVFTNKSQIVRLTSKQSP